MKMRIGRREVNVSNPDKVFFPKRKLRKIDLVEYYLDVADCVPANHPDWLETVHIKFPSGRTADFPVANEPGALAWIVNLGCIDLHTWHSRVDDVDRPDYLLIDLDPSEGNPWRHVRKIALVVKDVMDELGLTSFPKTSGSTGLHILAPIKPELGFPEVRRFAKAMAQEVERRIDDQRVATTTWKVADRLGVFVDYGQNSRDRTIASAYSIRPTPDARASAPLDWDEVATVKPERFTLTTMRKRIEDVGDLTKGMWRRKKSLMPLFSKLDLEPADPKKVDSGRRRGPVQRWESDQGGWQSRRQQRSARAKK
jgi:bifunctional non-homologous end joining protein LigD